MFRDLTLETGKLSSRAGVGCLVQALRLGYPCSTFVRPDHPCFLRLALIPRARDHSRFSKSLAWRPLGLHSPGKLSTFDRRGRPVLCKRTVGVLTSSKEGPDRPGIASSMPLEKDVLASARKRGDLRLLWCTPGVSSEQIRGTEKNPSFGRLGWRG